MDIKDAKMGRKVRFLPDTLHAGKTATLTGHTEGRYVFAIIDDEKKTHDGWLDTCLELVDDVVDATSLSDIDDVALRLILRGAVAEVTEKFGTAGERAVEEFTRLLGTSGVTISLDK